MIDEMKRIDNNRFEKILDSFNITKECLNCRIFIFNKEHSYRCAASPGCVAVTLSSKIISYLNWKINIISEKEHHRNVGLASSCSHHFKDDNPRCLNCNMTWDETSHKDKLRYIFNCFNCPDKQKCIKDDIDPGSKLCLNLVYNQL